LKDNRFKIDAWHRTIFLWLHQGYNCGYFNKHGYLLAWSEGGKAGPIHSSLYHTLKDLIDFDNPIVKKSHKLTIGNHEFIHLYKE